MYIYVYIYIYIHTYVYIYIYIYIHHSGVVLHQNSAMSYHQFLEQKSKLVLRPGKWIFPAGENDGSLTVKGRSLIGATCP